MHCKKRTKHARELDVILKCIYSVMKLSGFLFETLALVDVFGNQNHGYQCPFPKSKIKGEPTILGKIFPKNIIKRRTFNSQPTTRKSTKDERRNKVAQTLVTL